MDSRNGGSRQRVHAWHFEDPFKASCTARPKVLAQMATPVHVIMQTMSELSTLMGRMQVAGQSINGHLPTLFAEPRSRLGVSATFCCTTSSSSALFVSSFDHISLTSLLGVEVAAEQLRLAVDKDYPVRFCLISFSLHCSAATPSCVA